MKTKKKNRFLTFCTACIPGGGQMYMGFMKMGLSMMLLFAVTIIVSSWTQLGAIGCIAVVEWFYSFFQVNHLASLNDEEFAQVKDEYMLGLGEVPGIKEALSKYHRWIAYGLILLGASLLWDTVASLLRSILPEQFYFISSIMWRVGDYVPSVVVGCVVIYLGIKLISGKKVETGATGQQGDQIEHADLQKEEE